MATEVLQATTPLRESSKFANNIGHVSILSKKDPNKAVKSFPISSSDTTKITLGWNEDCAIRIVLPEVSGVHAEITVRNGKIYIANMSQTNPLLLNGKALSGKQVLTIGDSFSIAGRLFRLDSTPFVRQSKSANVSDENKAPNSSSKTPSKTPSAINQPKSASKNLPTPLSTRTENSSYATVVSNTPVKYDGEFKVPNFTPKKLSAATPKLVKAPSASPKIISTPSSSTSSIPRATKSVNRPVHRQGTPIRIPPPPTSLPPSIITPSVTSVSSVTCALPLEPATVPTTVSTPSTKSVDSSSPSKVPQVNQWATPLKFTPPVEAVVEVQAATPTDKKPLAKKGSKTEFVPKYASRDAGNTINSADSRIVKNQQRTSIGNGRLVKKSRVSNIPIITPIKSSTGSEDVPPVESITVAFEEIPLDAVDSAHSFAVPSEEPKAAPTPKSAVTPKATSSVKLNETPKSNFIPKTLHLSEVKKTPRSENTPVQSTTSQETPKVEVKQPSFSPETKLNTENERRERRKSTTNIEIKQEHQVETVFNTLATPFKKRKNRRSRKHKKVPITLSAQRPQQESFPPSPASPPNEIDTIFQQLETKTQRSDASEEATLTATPQTPVARKLASTPKQQTPKTQQTPKLQTPKIQETPRVPSPEVVATSQATSASRTPVSRTPRHSAVRTPKVSSEPTQSAATTPMQSRQEPTAASELVDELPRESQIKEVAVDERKETRKELLEEIVEAKPTDQPEKEEVVQESAEIEAQYEEKTPVELAKEVSEESKTEVDAISSNAITESSLSSPPMLVDLQEQFKSIYHIIRESLDSDGERRSKKLFRLPTKQSKSGKQYYELIKNPIDLQTINKKINNSEITSVQELQDVFNSLFTNALLFNQHQSPPDTNLVENVTFLQNALAQEIAKLSQPSSSPMPQHPIQAPQVVQEIEQQVEKTEEKKEHTPKAKKGRGKKQKEVQVSEPVETEKPVQEKEPVKAEPEEKAAKSTRKAKRGKAVEEPTEQTESVTTSEKPTAKKAPSLTDEEIKGMKVTELKAELKKRGLPQSGLKAELIQRLLTAVSSEN